MDDDQLTPDRGPGGKNRRRRAADAEAWTTGITRIAPNEIEIRGYPVDELMGRLTFCEAVYLLLRGELPTPAIGKLFGAVLLSSMDHGVTPPSTLAVAARRHVGRVPRDAVAAGILAFGTYHGGDIETCMRCLQEGLEMVEAGVTYEDAARRLLEKWKGEGPNPPGFGHRIHVRDPRARRLLQLAHELDLDGEHCRLLRVVERVINDMPGRDPAPAAPQHRRRHRRRLRGSGLRARHRRRAVHRRRACRGCSRTPSRSGCGRSPCASSIRATWSTTGRCGAGSPTRGSRSRERSGSLLPGRCVFR